MKKISVVTAVALMVAVLSGCYVSDEERAKCEVEGNRVMNEKFVTVNKGKGWFKGEVKSGPLYYCGTPDNYIKTVYNDEVTAVSDGFFGDSSLNIYIFNECKKLGGVTYHTEESDGESSSERFACVQDGRVLAFEHP